MLHFALRASRHCALARADLWLGAARLGLGATRDVSLGCRSPSRHRVFREDHVRHFTFRLDAETPFDGIRARSFCLQRALDRQPTTHSAKIPEHARSLAWTDICGGVRRGSSSIASLSRATLIQLHPWWTKNHEE